MMFAATDLMKLDRKLQCLIKKTTRDVTDTNSSTQNKYGIQVYDLITQDRFNRSLQACLTETPEVFLQCSSSLRKQPEV